MAGSNDTRQCKSGSHPVLLASSTAASIYRLRRLGSAPIKALCRERCVCIYCFPVVTNINRNLLIFNNQTVHSTTKALAEMRQQATHNAREIPPETWPAAEMMLRQEHSAESRKGLASRKYQRSATDSATARGSAVRADGHTG